MSKKLFNITLALALLLVLVPTGAGAAPPAQGGGQAYVIQADDWLSKLAEKYFGNVFAWQSIVVATNEKAKEDPSFNRIVDPDLLEVGWKIWIPSAEEAQAFMDTYSLAGNYITLYQFGDQSGPYAPITAPSIDAVNDAVAYLNATGGIRGATVRIIWADTGGNVEESISIYNRFREADPKPIVLFTYSSPETEALRDRYEEDQIPVFALGVSAPGMYPPAYAFGVVPIYPDQFGLMIDWLTENWASVKPANAGDQIKIGFVTWPGAFGQGSNTAESQAYAASKGVEIVAEELFNPGATDVTTQLLAAQAAGANVIWTNSLATGPAQILKDVAALGLSDDVLVTGVNWALDSSVIALAGEAADGMIAPIPYRWYNEDHPGITTILENLALNDRPASYYSLAYLVPFANVDAARIAIEQAIDEVGFENLDGQAVYNVLTTTPIEGLGGVVSYDWTGGRRAGNRMRVARIENGEFVFISDWLTTPDLKPQQ